jgi:(2Fe-2S) ferredoxin
VRFERHIFVCTNDRACRGRGGEDVLAALQLAVAGDPEMVGRIAITPCGCLGPCLEGPNAVAYPDGVWLAGLTIDDVGDIIAWLRGGDFPTRLRYEWPDDDADV